MVIYIALYIFEATVPVWLHTTILINFIAGSLIALVLISIGMFGTPKGVFGEDAWGTTLSDEDYLKLWGRMAVASLLWGFPSVLIPRNWYFDDLLWGI